MLAGQNTTCYQCGTARNDGGGRKEAGAGVFGAQAGVDTAMGRVVGPNGRNQVRVPGGDPTYRVNQGRKVGMGGKVGFLGGGGNKGNGTLSTLTGKRSSRRWIL